MRREHQIITCKNVLRLSIIPLELAVILFLVVVAYPFPLPILFMFAVPQFICFIFAFMREPNERTKDFNNIIWSIAVGYSVFTLFMAL